MSFERIFDRVQNKEVSSDYDRNREKAFAAFQKMGVPNRKDEEWKYTSLNWLPGWLSENESEKIEISDKKIAETISKEALKDSHQLVIVDGHLNHSLSDLGNNLWPVGIKVNSLREHFSKYSEKLKEISRHFTAKSFDAMNVAFAQDTTVIEVGKSIKPEQPIEIVHVTTGNNDIAASRVFLHVQPLAEVDVVQRFVDLSKGQLTNSSISICLEQGARSKFFQIKGNEESKISKYHFDRVRVLQKKDSFSEVLNVSLGGAISRHDAEIKVDGSGAFTGLYDLYLENGKDHVDYCSTITHSEPNSESEQLCKGILTDQSQAVFNGLIRIEQKAQQTNSSQLNKNLILSPKAEVNARPQLKIDADDVKASHGSTIGQLDPEEVFYLESRAIPREQAIEMLAQGFVEDVLFKIADSKIKEYFTVQVREKMKALQGRLNGL